jgi:hypothetical protein
VSRADRGFMPASRSNSGGGSSNASPSESSGNVSSADSTAQVEPPKPKTPSKLPDKDLEGRHGMEDRSVAGDASSGRFDSRLPTPPNPPPKAPGILPSEVGVLPVEVRVAGLMTSPRPNDPNPPRPLGCDDSRPLGAVDRREAGDTPSVGG